MQSKKKKEKRIDTRDHEHSRISSVFNWNNFSFTRNEFTNAKESYLTKKKSPLEFVGRNDISRTNDSNSPQSINVSIPQLRLHQHSVRRRAIWKMLFQVEAAVHGAIHVHAPTALPRLIASFRFWKIISESNIGTRFMLSIVDSPIKFIPHALKSSRYGWVLLEQWFFGAERIIC